MIHMDKGILFPFGFDSSRDNLVNEKGRIFPYLKKFQKLKKDFKLKIIWAIFKKEF